MTGEAPTASPALRARMTADWDRFVQAPRAWPSGVEISAAATELVEGIVRQALVEAGRSEGWDAPRTFAELAPVALGSFGRKDMTPYSDVDLMFCVDARPDEGTTKRVIDRALYSLWDLGFTVGHAVRTPDEAVALAIGDATIMSSLLDGRALATAGDAPPPPRGEALLETIDGQLSKEQVSSSFIEAKLAEAAHRRRRFGETVYLLQPNVKEGQGGLRDLHSAWWIARARWRVRPDDLLLLGILSPAEERAMERAYDFLLRARAEMHLVEDRRTDNLRFELQERLGEELGFRTGSHAHRDVATERFMRAYYFHAGHSMRIAQLLIERATSHERRGGGRSRPAPRGFKTWNDTLTVTHREQFARDPAALVRIFRVAQDEAIPIYSYTKELIRESRRIMNGAFRRRADVVSEFLSVVEDPKGDGSIVQEMHEMGVLRGVIPEFARVTARWQHSLYHVYTVDVHSIRVLRNLKALRRGELADRQPELTRWLAELARPAVLYLAGLLHDVGKGWSRGDHSERGERVARDVGARFETAGLPAWSAEETEDLAWLVREHLTMSDLSQRRDVDDPDLVADFARNCRTRERLRMLYILTHADMTGTSPKVWTSWKASLLAQLYRGAAAVLDSSARPRTEDHVRARRLRLAGEIEAEAEDRGDIRLERRDIEVFTRLASPRYLLGFAPRRMVRHVLMWRDVSRFGGLAVHTSHLVREGTTRLTVVCPDRKGLLALLAGTLAANGLQILSAQTFSLSPAAPEPEADAGGTLASGIPVARPELHQLVGSAPERTESRLVVGVLYVTDEQGGLCEDLARWRRFREDLEGVIFHGQDVDELFERRRPAPSIAPRPRPDVRVEVRFSNDDSPVETVIDVFGPDGLGALHRIAKALSSAGLVINLAKISTQGDGVADGFYVVDAVTGQKLTERARQDEIRKAIRAAFAAIGDRPRALTQIV